MTLQNFIRENREEIDQLIKTSMGANRIDQRLNDQERRLWILNYEPLYNLARMNGVRI